MEPEGSSPHSQEPATCLANIVSEYNMCVFIFIFRVTFVWNIFHSKKNWVRYDQKCILVFMLSTRYFRQILIKFLPSEHLFVKYWNIIFRENPSGVSQVFPFEWTDRHNEASNHFCNLAKAPNNGIKKKKIQLRCNWIWFLLTPGKFISRLFPRIYSRYELSIPRFFLSNAHVTHGLNGLTCKVWFNYHTFLEISLGYICKIWMHEGESWLSFQDVIFRESGWICMVFDRGILLHYPTNLTKIAFIRLFFEDRNYTKNRQD
jgi:hypothetical protein